MNSTTWIYLILSYSTRDHETLPAEAYTDRFIAEQRLKHLAETFNQWNTFTLRCIPLNPEF